MVCRWNGCDRISAARWDSLDSDVKGADRITGGRGKPSQAPKFFPFLQTSYPIPWLAVFYIYSISTAWNPRAMLVGLFRSIYNILRYNGRGVSRDYYAIHARYEVTHDVFQSFRPPFVKRRRSQGRGALVALRRGRKPLPAFLFCELFFAPSLSQMR